MDGRNKHLARKQARYWSRFLQRRRQVGRNIVRVFEPDREPHQAVADAKLGTCLRRQALMRRGGWMGDEAFGVAKIVGNAQEIQSVEESECARFAAGHLEGD